ncbi:MAG: Gfo/Idh/MocA family oxidoreductase [Chloroflexi bacterium]|nr:Gfo/Idh/MocA family oxidoreductase [Chloroflexota bacterium]
MTIRVGVVGLGMGRYHMERYQANEQVELVALCDLDQKLLDRFKGTCPKASTYTDYQEMFAAANLDAVSIALPNVLHAEVTIAALRAGMHVLCEKPMAVNAQQAKQMLLASQETGKKLMIHFNYRFSPSAQFFKRYVDEGNLGQIYYAKTQWLRARGIPKLGGWFGIKAMSGGGPMIDLGVHRLDLALWAMGYPKAVAVSASGFNLLGARLAKASQARYDVEDMLTALVRLENGITLNLEVSWAGGTDKREDMLTAIYGTDGAAIQRNTGEGYEFEAFGLRDVAGSLVKVTPHIYPHQCPSAVDHFVNCVINDLAPEASAENGLELMRIIDAIYLSAAEGREVRLDEQQ